MKSSLGMRTPWTTKEIESRCCPYPHANFYFEETGDDASQIIFRSKAKVMGRREEETRSDMTGLRGISKLLQRDSTFNHPSKFVLVKSNYKNLVVFSVFPLTFED
jgi:hypothetical protein